MLAAGVTRSLDVDSQLSTGATLSLDGDSPESLLGDTTPSSLHSSHCTVFLSFVSENVSALCGEVSALEGSALSAVSMLSVVTKPPFLRFSVPKNRVFGGSAVGSFVEEGRYMGWLPSSGVPSCEESLMVLE